MAKPKEILPSSFALAAAFYLLPLLIIDTGSAMFILLLVLPLFCLGVSTVYGFRHGKGISLPLVTTLLFVPTIFIFFNDSAWFYAPAFGLIALVGNSLGALVRYVIHRSKPQNK